MCKVFITQDVVGLLLIMYIIMADHITTFGTHVHESTYEDQIGAEIPDIHKQSQESIIPTYRIVNISGFTLRLEPVQLNGQTVWFNDKDLGEVIIYNEGANGKLTPAFDSFNKKNIEA